MEAQIPRRTEFICLSLSKAEINPSHRHWFPLEQHYYSNEMLELKNCSKDGKSETHQILYHNILLNVIMMQTVKYCHRRVHQPASTRAAPSRPGYTVWLWVVPERKKTHDGRSEEKSLVFHLNVRRVQRWLSSRSWRSQTPSDKIPRMSEI